METRLINIRI